MISTVVLHSLALQHPRSEKWLFGIAQGYLTVLTIKSFGRHGIYKLVELQSLQNCCLSNRVETQNNSVKGPKGQQAEQDGSLRTHFPFPAANGFPN